MQWILFLDDERNPENVTWAPWWIHLQYRKDNVMIARNFDEALELLNEFGMPIFASFDHDLGNRTEKTGYDLVKYMVECDMDGIHSFDEDFDFYVHSKNPVGSNNILNYLGQYLRSKT
jgi:hypothetical protein